MLVLCFLFACAFVASDATDLAKFITPCRPKDTACLKSSAQKAVPFLAAGIADLGIETMDPMTVGRVNTVQAGLHMDFRDTTVRGLRNCVVLNLRRLYDKTLLDLKCSVTLVGEYTLGGQLLILPIEGTGKYRIRIRDIIMKIILDVEERIVEGDRYWHVSDWKHSAEDVSKVEYQFQNLFNGNRDLAKTIHDFANSNWREIFQEVAPPMVKAIVSKIIHETFKLFDKVPIKDLALE
uniref:Juvenile hormone binding protein n=1 Tax=Bombyx mori TaxID=7091 RepID=C6KYM5_BOMMO|nr:juvenile hormone binding protein [Bombyx mori]